MKLKAPKFESNSRMQGTVLDIYIYIFVVSRVSVIVLSNALALVITYVILYYPNPILFVRKEW